MYFNNKLYFNMYFIAKVFLFGVAELSESIVSVPDFRYNYQLELGQVSLADHQGTLLSELRDPTPDTTC